MGRYFPATGMLSLRKNDSAYVRAHEIAHMAQDQRKGWVWRTFPKVRTWPLAGKLFKFYIEAQAASMALWWMLGHGGVKPADILEAIRCLYAYLPIRNPLTSIAKPSIAKEMPTRSHPKSSGSGMLCLIRHDK